jgi:hypothetical protein
MMHGQPNVKFSVCVFFFLCQGNSLLVILKVIDAIDRQESSVAGNEVGLEQSAENIKYMSMSCHQSV